MASCAKVTDILKITQEVKARFQLQSVESQTPHTTHCPLNCVVIGENCCGGLYAKEDCSHLLRRALWMQGSS